MNNMGWICPNCNKANAPWMPYCCNSIKINSLDTKPTIKVCPHGSSLEFGCFICRSGELK